MENAASAHDGTGVTVSPEVYAELFDAPRFDASKDTFSVWVDDQLAGTGSLWIRDELFEGRAMVGMEGTTAPEFRGRGFGAAILDRLEKRGADLAAERFPDTPVRLRTSGGLADSSAQQLLELRGYRPDNYFVTMHADLTTWSDPGTATDTVAPTKELSEAVREAHNDAFRDHRNFTAIPTDDWAHWESSSAMRPTHGRVVVENGRVLAYAICGEYEPGVLHVELVGTRREARGRGLARAVLVDVLRGAQQHYPIAELEVDHTSPTGADRLYTSVGFRPVRTISRYIRDLAS